MTATNANTNANEPLNDKDMINQDVKIINETLAWLNPFSGTTLFKKYGPFWMKALDINEKEVNTILDNFTNPEVATKFPLVMGKAAAEAYFPGFKSATTDLKMNISELANYIKNSENIKKMKDAVDTKSVTDDNKVGGGGGFKRKNKHKTVKHIRNHINNHRKTNNLRALKRHIQSVKRRYKRG